MLSAWYLLVVPSPSASLADILEPCLCSLGLFGSLEHSTSENWSAAQTGVEAIGGQRRYQQNAGHTTLVVGSLDQILKIYFRLDNIFSLLFSRNLALDCYGARVIHSLQFLKNARKVNSSCPDRNLFPKLPRVGREETIFRVNSANEVTDNIHGVYWISLSIENKVGQIQIYKNVIQTHILNHA